MSAVDHALTSRKTANSNGKTRWMATCTCGWITGGTTTTEARALKLGQEQHIDRLRPRCPTPSKQRFKSRDTAEDAMSTFWLTSGKGKVMPTRVYECPCGGWHLTSKPLRVWSRS